MPFDIKEGLTQKIGPLPAFAWGGILGGGFLLYRHFRGGNTQTVATTQYGNPPADLGQVETDPSGVWPGGYGVGNVGTGIGGSTGVLGNTGDVLYPDNSGTGIADPYTEYAQQTQQMLSDFLGALPQTWGIGDAPLTTVVSHDPGIGTTPDVTNPSGNGAPPPAPTVDSRLTTTNPARVPSLAEFIASHPSDNATAAGRQRLTTLWQTTFGARWNAYVSANGGNLVQPPMSLTGGGAPPPRTGVAPAYQPVQQTMLPTAPVTAYTAPASNLITKAVQSVISAVTSVLNPVTTNASGLGRQVGPWRTAAMRDSAVAPAIAAGKRVRKFSTDSTHYYAEIFD